MECITSSIVAIIVRFINNGAHRSFEKCLFEACEERRKHARALRLEGKELRETNKLQWAAMLDRALCCLEKTKSDIENSLKSADWKVRIARELKRCSSASNVWIAEQLNMGVPQAVSMHTSRVMASDWQKDEGYQGFLQLFENNTSQNFKTLI